MSWKLQDLAVENAVAANYDLLYNNTRFAKHMYGSFGDFVLQYATNGKVLELACGTAILSQIIMSKAHALESHCMDFAPRMLEVAKTRCDNCVQADLESLSYVDESFEIVFVHSALHHFPRLDDIFMEVKRILKSGGYLIIQEPNLSRISKDTVLRILTFALRTIGTRQYPDLSHLEGGHQPSEHHGLLSMDKVRKSLEKTGFMVDKMGYRYYASAILKGFDNKLAHAIGLLLDPLYTNKYKDGYMFFVVSRKV